MVLVLTIAQTPVFALTPTLPPPTCSSSLTITGLVYSTVTQQGIAGATVIADTSVSHPFATTTAADGTYTLVIPATSNYACLVTGLRVTAAGYQNYNRTINSSQLFLQPTQNFGMLPLTTATRTNTPSCGGVVVATATFTPTWTATPRTATATPTSCGVRYVTPTPIGPTATRTRTPTATGTGGFPTVAPTFTRTFTPTQSVVGACSPVNSIITAPFVFDGAGVFCWQSSNLGTFINSWSTTSVTLNGVNVTNMWVPSSSYPAQVGGFWYVAYNSGVAWGHFEAK
jgi:hypothetical protein